MHSSVPPPQYVFMAWCLVKHGIYFGPNRIIFRINHFKYFVTNRDSSVDIGLGYGQDGWGSRVRFPAVAENFSPHHRVQNGCEAHPASYPMGNGGSFPGGKAAGA
jgi:hypothetical protein